MKILLVTHEDPGNIHGGLGRFITEFTRELKKCEDVRLLFLNLNGQEYISSSPIIDYQINVCYHFPADSNEGKLLDSSFHTRKAAQTILNSYKPDIIHCNDRQTFLPFRDLPNVVFSLHLSYPDLRTPWNWDQALFDEHKIERCALSDAKAVIVYSRFMVEKVSKIKPGCRPYLLPLGANLESLSGRKANESAQNLVISFFGRFDNHQKGLNEYIKAIEHIHPDFIINHGLEFRIYGKGDIASLGSLPRFSFVGFADMDQYPKALEETNIVVMPSRYEPFGLVGLEALAANCLLLAPVGQGMDEFFIPGVNGLAIECNPTSIREVLEYSITNWESVQKLSKNARSTVDKWTWRNCVDAHLKVYEKVI